MWSMSERSAGNWGTTDSFKSGDTDPNIPTALVSLNDSYESVLNTLMHVMFRFDSIMYDPVDISG